jgi:hypothetical protein
MRGAVAAAAAAEEEAAGMDTLPVVVALRKEMAQLKETVAQLREEMDFKVSQLRAELRGARLAPDRKVVQTYESALKKRRILQAKPSEIEKDELSRLQDYVLLRLYQEIPSRNDFADVKIISKIEYNAIIMRTIQTILWWREAICISYFIIGKQNRVPGPGTASNRQTSISVVAQSSTEMP